MKTKAFDKPIGDYFSPKCRVVHLQLSTTILNGSDQIKDYEVLDFDWGNEGYHRSNKR